MTRTVIDIVIRDGTIGTQDPGDGAAPAASDHDAMVSELHAVVSQICPGVTREALERMLTPALHEQTLENAAAAQSLDDPQGSA
jgi:hypothetical protein